jgi:hypothetical protein
MDDFQREVQRLRNERRKKELLASGPGAAADVARGAASGLAEGAVSLPGMPADMMNFADIGWQYLMSKGLEWAGQLTPEQAEGIRKPLPGLEDRSTRMGLPSSELLLGAAKKAGVPGVGFEPQTPAGHFAQDVGRFVPGAVAPGQAVAQAGRGTRALADIGQQAVLPAVGMNAGEAIGEGIGGEEGRTVGGVVGALAGGGVGAALPSPRTGQPFRDFDPRAVNTVGQAVADQGGAARTAQELEALGPGGVLGETGENTRALLEQMVTTPGPQQQRVMDPIRERRAQAGNQVEQAVDSLFGAPPASYAEQTELLRNTKRATAGRLYGEAERIAAVRGIDTSPVTRYIESTIPRAVAGGTVDRLTDIEQAKVRIGELLAGRNDFQSVHRVKEMLDDQVGAAVRDGEGGKARELGAVRDRLVRVLDDATIDPAAPGTPSAYQEARRQYASDSAFERGREYGQKLFDQKVRSDEFAMHWRSSDPAVQRAIQQGARDNIDDAMDKLARTADDEGARAAITKFSSRSNRAKLALMFGQAEADRLVGVLEGQARQLGTYNRLTGQSATYARQRAGELIPNPAQQDLPAAQYPTFSQLALKGVDRLGAATVGPLRRNRAERTNADIGRLLMQGGGSTPAERLLMLQQLEQAYGARGIPTGTTPAFSLWGSQIDEDRR